MSNLKVYISCGLNQYEKYEDIKEEIELFDIDVTFDWTKFFKNKEAPMELARNHMKEALSKLKGSELFILYLDEKSHPNQFFEFGFFYDLMLQDKNKLMIIFSQFDPFGLFAYSALPGIKFARSLKDLKYNVMEWLENKGANIKNIDWDDDLYQEFEIKERF